MQHDIGSDDDCVITGIYDDDCVITGIYDDDCVITGTSVYDNHDEEPAQPVQPPDEPAAQPVQPPEEPAAQPVQLPKMDCEVRAHFTLPGLDSGETVCQFHSQGPRVKQVIVQISSNISRKSKKKKAAVIGSVYINRRCYDIKHIISNTKGTELDVFANVCAAGADCSPLDCLAAVSQEMVGDWNSSGQYFYDKIRSFVRQDMYFHYDEDAEIFRFSWEGVDESYRRYIVEMECVERVARR